MLTDKKQKTKLYIQYLLSLCTILHTSVTYYKNFTLYTLRVN